MTRTAAPELTGEALRALLVREPERGWRVFVDQYTPRLLASIAREDVSDRDDAADVYLLVCERLAANRAERLRRHDPGKGALGAWLTTVVRHVVIDWVRSRAGRRRLFGAVTRLDRFDQRVFELYYWDHRSCPEIVELLAMEGHRSCDLGDVLTALQRIDEAMSERHRRQLLATMARPRLDSPAFLAIEAATTKHYGAVTLPTMSRGATDMAYLRAKGIQCYGVGPAIDFEDGPKGFGAHSDQERIHESELYRFVKFHWDIVVDLAGAR